MKPICKSKTFHKGEDLSILNDFVYDHVNYEESPLDTNYHLKYKTIITITKVVEDETDDKKDI